MFSFRYAPDFPGYFEVLYHPKTNLYFLKLFYKLIVTKEGFIVRDILRDSIVYLCKLYSMYIVTYTFLGCPTFVSTDEDCKSKYLALLAVCFLLIIIEITMERPCLIMFEIMFEINSRNVCCKNCSFVFHLPNKFRMKNIPIKRTTKNHDS